jgi:hypothetical protein
VFAARAGDHCCLHGLRLRTQWRHPSYTAK